MSIRHILGKMGLPENGNLNCPITKDVTPSVFGLKHITVSKLHIVYQFLLPTGHIVSELDMANKNVEL